MAVASSVLVSESAPSAASAKIDEPEKGATTWLKRSPGTVDYENNIFTNKKTYAAQISIILYTSSGSNLRVTILFCFDRISRTYII